MHEGSDEQIQSLLVRDPPEKEDDLGVAAGQEARAEAVSVTPGVQSAGPYAHRHRVAGGVRRDVRDQLAFLFGSDVQQRSVAEHPALPGCVGQRLPEAAMAPQVRIQRAVR